MNKKKLMATAAVAIMAISGCSTKDGGDMVELTGKNIETEMPFMRFPVRIGLYGDHIVMLDLAADSCFYHAVGYPDFQYSCSLGKRGNGPREILLPTPFQIYKDRLFLYDGNKGNLFDIDLNGKRNMDLQTKIHFNVNTCVDFVCVDDSTVILGDLSGKNRLLCVTPQSKQGILTLPSEFSEQDAAKQGSIWRSYMDINHTLNRIVLATQFGEVIEIISLNDYSVKRITGKDGIPRSASRQINGYLDVKWHKNNIYALYSARTEEELKRQSMNNQRPESGGDIIQVFDRHGDRIKTYHLDILINGFTIDEENNLLIGISSNTDNPVYVFELD
jgi:hypothetical protein